VKCVKKQLLLAQEAAGQGNRCSIVVTQPRRIAAASLANRVCGSLP